MHGGEVLARHLHGICSTRHAMHHAMQCNVPCPMPCNMDARSTSSHLVICTMRMPFFVAMLVLRGRLTLKERGRGKHVWTAREDRSDHVQTALPNVRRLCFLFAPFDLFCWRTERRHAGLCTPALSRRALV